ncbi:BURP domain-containing protein [Rhynchospora pubera]|uniref:BURP domain-containing protein n=1 Tax=Rhynchospora pubera TaxID=906938 RepID=A0AAV8C2J7_9POAL|nr:BURP domain-containing protein [Rhynchospora pubera]
MSRFLVIFLSVIIAVKADISPLDYWRNVLPNTEMPSFFMNHLIDPDLDVTLLAKRPLSIRKGLAQYYFILFGPLPSKEHILSTFFPQSAMYPGTKMDEGTNFTRTMWGNVFVPRPEADAVPFSTKNLPQLLDHFSMVPSSKEAKDLKQLIVDCEAPNMVGETKFCPTSLESMIDNVVSLMGTHDVSALTTTINSTKLIAQHNKVVYRTTSPIKSFPDHTKLIICHPSPCAQAVHYCHTNTKYKGYVIPLMGSDGSTVNALTICHHDYMNFNPGFFEVLKMEPGSQPICHFLPENHIVWVRSDQIPTLRTVSSGGSGFQF